MLPDKRNAMRMKLCIILSLGALVAFYLLGQQRRQVAQVFTQFQHADDERETFVRTAMQTLIEQPFDGGSIRDLCSSKTWTDGLIFECDSPQGGVGNVENFFINCVRFAIEAGGTSKSPVCIEDAANSISAAFIVPQIMARSPSDLSDLTTNELVDFSYLFDRAHFKDTLSTACPQMRLYDSLKDIQGFPSAATPILLNPQDLATEFLEGRVLAKPNEWRSSFDTFLDMNKSGRLTSADPIVVQIHNVLLEFPISYDTTTFVSNFGRMFRFREDTRRLAAHVLFEISTRFPPDLQPTSRIAPDAYLGAHLRTDSDAAKAGWPGYDVQAAAYLEQAAKHNLDIIYVASGSLSDILQFRHDAALQRRTVVTKEDLLGGRELEELQRLTWDQQALVDFEVLAKSSQFGGIELSSFAWKIATKRHLLSNIIDPAAGTQALEDEYSVIYGAGSGSFFTLAMWP